MIKHPLIIKHLEIVLKENIGIGTFSVFDILMKKCDFDFNNPDERSDFNRVKFAVEQLGKTYKYFEAIDNRPGIFKLSLVGIKAKEIGGHLKYQKSLNKKPMSLYQKIYLTGFFIFGASTLFLSFQNNSLKSDYNSLKPKYDSLKSQSDYYKDSIVELKEQIELYKLKTSNDTLQTKSLNDLKTD